MEEEVDQEMFNIGSLLINSCSTNIMHGVSDLLEDDDDPHEVIGSLMVVILHTILKHPEIRDPMKTALAVGTVLYTITQRELQERTVN